MVICSTCSVEKPFEAFYKSNRTRCKSCVKASVNAYRQENLEKVRAYDKLRASVAHRVEARKEYAASPRGRERHAVALKVSAARFPERHAARIKFRNAVRDGKVTPWPVCAVPECCGKPEGHHPDYSQPLDVVWLCTTHHRDAHKIAEETP